MVFRAAHYSELALDLHQRERKIKAKRGRILDRNGIVLADNQPVCTISVIHNQIRDPNAVIALLCSKLGLSEETVRKRVKGIQFHRKNQKQCRSGNRGGNLPDRAGRHQGGRGL